MNRHRNGTETGGTMESLQGFLKNGRTFERNHFMPIASTRGTLYAHFDYAVLMRSVDHGLLLTTKGFPGSIQHNYRQELHLLLIDHKLIEALKKEIMYHACIGILASYADGILQMLVRMLKDGKITEAEFRALAKFLKDLFVKAVDNPSRLDDAHRASIRQDFERLSSLDFDKHWMTFVDDVMNLFSKHCI